MDAMKTIADLQRINPQLHVDENSNESGPDRIAANFDEVVRKLPDNAVLGSPLTENHDIVMSPGEVRYGISESGNEAILIGTGVQPFLVERNGHIGVPDELSDEYSSSELDKAKYDDFYGVLADHLPRQYMPHKIEVPGQDEESDLEDEAEFEEPEGNFSDDD